MLDYNYTGWSINTPVLFTTPKTIHSGNPKICTSTVLTMKLHFKNAVPEVSIISIYLYH